MVPPRAEHLACTHTTCCVLGESRLACATDEDPGTWFTPAFDAADPSREHLTPIAIRGGDFAGICVTTSSGRIYCGEASALRPGGSGLKLVPLPDGLHAESLAVGDYHAAAVARNGKLLTWGANADGALGFDKGQRQARVPTVVADLGDAQVGAVSVSDTLTCALLMGGAIRCFGDNLLGQLGSVDRALSGKPPNVVPSVPLRARKATAVQAGHRFACAILDDKSVSCWGEDGGPLREAELWARNHRLAKAQSKQPAPIALPDGRAAVGMWIHGVEICVALDDGRLACWGMPPDAIYTFDNGRMVRDLAWSGESRPWIVLDDGRILSPRSRR
jgi:hypothetical protein